MRPILLLTLAATFLGAAEARGGQSADSLEARIWLDRGEEPVVQRGDEVRVYYRTSADAHVAIFRIDTDGRISLLFPHHPDGDVIMRGGRDYRLLFPRSPRWRVEEDPGVGYFFMVASPEPMDFSLFAFDEELGWDLSAVGADVYEDPYVAIDDYVATIVPDWDVVPYALDFLTYDVGTTHTYPRFLCYDCHDRRSYAAWNPYVAACTSYRVVIWDDPYFYPRYRYVGTRVVYARPIDPRPRYGVVVRAPGSAWTPLVRAREAPARRVVDYKEAPTAAPAYQPRNPRPSARPGGSPAPATTRRATPSSILGRAAPPATGARMRGAAPSDRDVPDRPSVSGIRAGSRRGAPAATTPPRDERTRPTLQRRPTMPSERLRDRGAVPGATSRGTTSRGTTAIGGGRPGRSGSVAPARERPPTRIIRPPASQRPRMGPARAPTRVVPGSGSSVRPGGRPSVTGRPALSGGSRAVRPPPRGGRGGAVPPRRRPGGRGGGGGAR